MSGNGKEFPATGNPLVDAALRRLNQQFAELADAMVVQAHLERRQSDMLATHQQIIEKHALSMREIDERLSALTMWLMKREGLPEAGGSE